MLKFGMLIFLGALGMSHAYADEAWVDVGDTGMLAFQMAGDGPGPAAEIYHDLDQASFGVDRVHLYGGNILLISKSVRAFYSPHSPNYRVEIVLDFGGSIPNDNLNKQIAQGRVDLASDSLIPLTKVLIGDNDSYNRFVATAGKYVRCSTPGLTSYEPSCQFSLNQPLISPLPAHQCEAFVASIAEIYNGPRWGEGESVKLIVRVRKNLVDSLTSIQFEPTVVVPFEPVSYRFNLVPGETEFFELTLNTIENPHGGLTIAKVYTGYLLLRTNNGKAFYITPSEDLNSNFVIDSALAQKLPDRFDGSNGMPVLIIPSLSKTANLPGIGHYLNPVSCK